MLLSRKAASCLISWSPVKGRIITARFNSRYIRISIENFNHLKMTSEKSKRRDFLALIFISKSASKKLLIAFIWS